VAENLAPVAKNDSVSLLQDSSATFASVLANDTDKDSAAVSLRAYVVTGPMHGSLVLNADGTFTYTPAPDFFGTDSFTYYANNGVWSEDSSIPMSGNSNVATVTITVNPLPATSITFNRADLWLSTSSSNRKYDVKVEVLRNGVMVLEKTISAQLLGFGTTFNKAVYKSVGGFLATAVDFAPSDTLSLRVSMKLSAGSQGGDNASGATRLWYNVPTPPPANNSHLHANRAGTDVRYYLMSGFALQKDGTVSGPTQYIDKIVYKTGFTVLGTWSITGP
jgi:hypothetical protein